MAPLRTARLKQSERGEVFSWGKDDLGQCGHGGSFDQGQLLPRRVEALTVAGVNPGNF